jgi:hypothetical protein
VVKTKLTHGGKGFPFPMLNATSSKQLIRHVKLHSCWRLKTHNPINFVDFSSMVAESLTMFWFSNFVIWLFARFFDFLKFNSLLSLMGTPRALMGGFLIYVSFLALKKKTV